jgi:hypothetical protein
VQAALFLLVLPFVSVSLQTSKFHGAGPNSRLVGALAAAA